ncbi:hypothetical protein ZWY2020_039814 [Hordeum vulgare]|nr:hypothetical protein ZWY2020_039814 [Hordeum vulgare]
MGRGVYPVVGCCCTAGGGHGARSPLVVRPVVHIDGTERTRASPQAICRLYKHINEDQRVAIRDMGTGPFLDIKCGYLHNTIMTWFTGFYQPRRRGFVMPRHGFIELTEESVHQILGIPRGDSDFKYEAEYDNEDKILRYLVALDCDGQELELPDTPYTVNAWSKTHVDVVVELDMLEHDPPSFGNFQDQLKATTVISKFESGVGTLFTESTSGVDTLLTELMQGLTAPATSNASKSRINRGTKIGESDDTSSEDSSESDNDTNEHNVDIEHDKKKRMTRSDNNSPTDTMVSHGNSHQVEEKIRGSAAGLANGLCELKTTRLNEIEQGSGRTHEEINHVVAKELGLLKEPCGQQFEEINDDKNSRKINARPLKQTPRR